MWRACGSGFYRRNAILQIEEERQREMKERQREERRERERTRGKLGRLHRGRRGYNLIRLPFGLIFE